MALDRNTQINFQGDPAKEAAFISGQDERTAEAARAAEPQLVTTDQSALNESIRAADILDPTQAAGFEAADAPPGADAGANVNADFEENVRTGADQSGEVGEAGAGGAPLTSGYFEGDDPANGPQQVTLGYDNPEEAPTGDNVEVANPEGGDAAAADGDAATTDTPAEEGTTDTTDTTTSTRKRR